MAVEPPSHKGRARERVKRRQERQHVARPGTGRLAPQLMPQGAFKMPKVRLPQNKVVFYLAGGIVLLLAIILGLGGLKETPATVEPNALWLGDEWTLDTHVDRQFEDLATLLRANRIGTVYAWVSLLQSDGTWADTDKFAALPPFVRQFNQAYPGATLYGWVSIAWGDEGQRLDDTTLQQTVADFGARLVSEFGFEGIFLNVQPIASGDEDFLALLRAVRAAVGDEVPIAVAAPPDWSPADESIPAPRSIARGTIWETSYKQNVALLVDQIAVVAHGSYLTSADDYILWVAYQVRSFAEAIAELDVPTRIIVGVPTYAAAMPAHDPAVENIDTAIDGVRLGMTQAGDAAQYVQGVGLYASWETDEREWARLQTKWVEGA